MQKQCIWQRICNTVDQIQIQKQIHDLTFDQIQIQIHRICICICKYKDVFDPSPVLCADDLVFITDTQGGCISKLKAWKVGIEIKGSCVNMKKTKLLVSGDDQDLLQKSGKYPCAVCCGGVCRNQVWGQIRICIRLIVDWTFGNNFQWKSNK